MREQEEPILAQIFWQGMVCRLDQKLYQGEHGLIYAYALDRRDGLIPISGEGGRIQFYCYVEGKMVRAYPKPKEPAVFVRLKPVGDSFYEGYELQLPRFVPPLITVPEEPEVEVEKAGDVADAETVFIPPPPRNEHLLKRWGIELNGLVVQSDVYAPERACSVYLRYRWFKPVVLLLVVSGIGEFAESTPLLFSKRALRYFAQTKDVRPEKIVEGCMGTGGEAIIEEGPSIFGTENIGVSVAMVLIWGDRAYYAHSGDAAIYQYHAQGLKKLSEDHTRLFAENEPDYARELHQARFIKRGYQYGTETLFSLRAYEEAQKKYSLLRAVAPGYALTTEVKSISLETGDKLILTNAGGQHTLTEWDMLEVIELPVANLAVELTRGAVDYARCYEKETRKVQEMIRKGHLSNKRLNFAGGERDVAFAVASVVKDPLMGKFSSAWHASTRKWKGSQATV